MCIRDRYPNNTVNTIAITNATAMDSAYTHIRSNTGIVSNEEKANAVVVTPRTCLLYTSRCV